MEANMVKHGNTTDNSPRGSRKKQNPVSIHPVVMSDFELQDWRSVQRVNHSPTSKEFVAKVNRQFASNRNSNAQKLNTIR